MSREEEAIAKAQAAAAKSKGADGLNEHHKSTIVGMNERILVFVLVIAVFALLVLWMTAESALVLYGSLFGVILLTVLWGILRLQRIQKTRLIRQQQAESWKSENEK